MSAEPAPRPHPAKVAAARTAPLRPVLRALPRRVQQQRMGRLGFAILIVVMLAAGLGAEVDHLRGPQNLQEEAKKLGMRPNPYGSYIDLRTGKVMGTQTRVDGKEAPGLIGETAKSELGQP